MAKKTARKTASKSSPGRKAGATRARKATPGRGRAKVAKRPAKKASKTTRRKATKKPARKVAKKKVARQATRKSARKVPKRAARPTVRKARKPGGSGRAAVRKASKAVASKTGRKARPSGAVGGKSAPRKPASGRSAEADVRPSRRKLRGPYTKTQLRPLRKALLVLRARVVSDLTLMEDEALRAVDPDVSAEDVAAHGTDAFERTITLNLMENDVRRVQHIDEALRRMQTGVYGLCSACESPIPLLRLEALPFAQACVPCQELQERGP